MLLFCRFIIEFLALLVVLCCDARLSRRVREVREGREGGGEGREGECTFGGEGGGEEELWRTGGGGGAPPALAGRFSLLGRVCGVSLFFL